MSLWPPKCGPIYSQIIGAGLRQCLNPKPDTLVCGHLDHQLCKFPALGPLHTQAKNCDHEIVRAQKKVPKGRPNTPPKLCSVVTDPQV